MSWQSFLTSQFQIILWTEETKYYSQANHLEGSHQSFHLYAITRIGHLRNNSRIFTKRLNGLWFLNLVFFFTVFLFLLIFILLFLYYELHHHSSLIPIHFPSFSCATVHCSSSQLLILSLLIHTFPCLHLLLLSSPTCNQTLPSYTLTTCWLAYYTTAHIPSPLHTLTPAPSTTTTEINPDAHKSHKTQQPQTSSPTHPSLFPLSPF
jgi:hypothetical protein